MENLIEGKGGDEGQAERAPQEERSERRLLAIVLVAGIAAFFFGFFHVLNTIRTSTGAEKLAQSNTNALGVVGQEIQNLKNKDTDGDGLSDYDELYIDKTSPYLKDSDGDGIPDNTEITHGTDPNCPQGQTCSALGQPANTNSTAGTNSVLGVNQGTAAATGQFTASELRTMLRDAGAPVTQLDAMSDEQIIAAYQQAYTQQSNSNASAATNGTINGSSSSIGTNGTTTAPITTEITALRNFTPAQIREFLKQGGADDTSLNQMDDATLKAVFQSALDNMNTNS